MKGDGKMPGVGGKMMGDTAGFTNPEFNVSRVNVAVGPDQGIPGQNKEAVTAGQPGDLVTNANGPSLGHGVLMPESMSSIIAIAILWMFRMYLVLIVMSYARLVLRRWVMANAGRNIQLYTGSQNAGMLENPFNEQSPEGAGWKGKLGRLMVAFGRSYWLGSEEGDEGWMNEEIALGSLGRNEQRGVGERERRRRSGTVCPFFPSSLSKYLLSNCKKSVSLTYSSRVFTGPSTASTSTSNARAAHASSKVTGCQMNEVFLVTLGL